MSKTQPLVEVFGLSVDDKSKDAKSSSKKAPQKTLMEKRQAKKDKKNKPVSIG